LSFGPAADHPDVDSRGETDRGSKGMVTMVDLGAGVVIGLLGIYFIGSPFLIG
jgi:hypothetical protein